MTSMKVLIVEDEEDDALLMIRMLKKGGYDPEYLRVESAVTMREALREKQWDVILCDYNLRVFNGLKATALLKEMNLDIPLIIVSGAIGEETAAECMRLGARDYIRKENLPLLVPAVQREITEAQKRKIHKQVEAQLHKSETNYRSLAETTKDFILTTDLNFKITFANNAVRNFVEGIEPVGQNLIDITSPKLLPVQQEMMRRKQEGYHDVSSFEWEAVDTTGAMLVMDVQSKPIQEDGHWTSILFVARDITRLKLDEKALKESEERLAQLAEQSQTIAWEVDAEGLYTFVSPVAKQVIGYQPEEIADKKYFYDLHPAEGRAAFKTATLETFKRKEAFLNLTNPVEAKDGRMVWVSTSGLPLLHPDGTLRGYRGSDTNISERKQTEEAIKHLLERFELATAAANLSVWDWDILQNQLMWDDRMYELYGVKREDFTGAYEAWLKGIHPDDIARSHEESQKALSGQKDYNTEFRIILSDGTIKYIRAYAKVIRDDQGAPLRMTGINYDITEHKQAESALRESERRYRSLFTEMLEGFALHEIICDDQGSPVDYRFLDINPAFERLTGLTAAGTIGKTVRQLLPQTETYWIETYGKIALTGAPAYFENYAKDLNRYYQVNAFCPQKGQFAVLFTDITERKKMEAQLVQSQKMEAIGTLAGGIAHDFNNILGAIMGYAGMAQDELPEGSPTLGCIDEIIRASERAKKLIEQILAFSRRQDAERKPLLIVPVIKEIIKLLRPMLPATICIQQDIHIQDASILADTTQIHQVLMNLCTNAAHAMQEKGGTLTVGLKPITVTEENDSFYDPLQTGTYLELQIADTGHGIDEKIHNQIFEPFFTTKKTGEGTGMGLSVVHGIVKSYGGHVRLESKAGNGTTFFVYLPMLHQQNIPSADEVRTAQIGGKERILLIDDQDVMLDMMSMTMSRLGYKVKAQASSLTALELFKTDPLAFDLVITDQTMPHLTGIDMAREMMLIRPDVPVILCTGYSTAVSSEQAKLAGIRKYVMKPFRMSDFTRLIRTVLEESKPWRDK